MRVRVTNPAPEIEVARGGRAAPTSGPLGIRRAAISNPCGCGRMPNPCSCGRASNPCDCGRISNPCSTCGLGVPPNPPGNASSRERRAWAMSQVGRIPNPGPDPRGPASAAQLLMGRRQKRATKLALGMRGELATPERITNCCDIGPLALALRASTSPSSYPNLYESNPAPNPGAVYWGSGAPGWQNWGWRPRSAPAVSEDQYWHPWRYPPQSNPGWLLGLGAGIVGAAAGAAANCYPRVLTDSMYTTADGLETKLRISFAPCGRGASRYEAIIARRNVQIAPAGNPPRRPWRGGQLLERLREQRLQQEAATAPAPIPAPTALPPGAIEMMGPVYFGSYIEALNWADAQTGIAWREQLTQNATIMNEGPSTPQSNPGWMLGIGAGLVGAAAGAFANCWPRVIADRTFTSPEGRRMSLRIRFAPCGTSQRFEATVTPRADSGMTTSVAGPMHFSTYEEALAWADEQSGLSWSRLLERKGIAQPTEPAGNPSRQFQYTVQQSDLLRSNPTCMRPARAVARANIRAANPGVWPPASAHSPFAPLPPRWFYYQSPSTAGAPPAPGVPVAAPGPPPGVWGRGNLCYADRDCGPNAYCDGGVCVTKPWANPAPNPVQMQSITVPLAPGFA